MYTGNIKSVIGAYKKHFSEIAPLERYKWRNIRIFQENWDIENPDFLGMMRRALPSGKIYNLLDSGAFYAPLANMKKMAQDDPGRVQTLFKHLFSNDFDFETDRSRFRAKLADFEKGADELYRELCLSGGSSQTDDRAAMFYLAFKYPDRFCLYKPSDLDKFYTLAGLPFLTKSSSKFEKLCMYLILWHAVRYEIAQDPELQDMARAAISEDEYPDPDFTVLAQDIIYSLNYSQVMADLDFLTPNKALPNLLRPAPHPLPAISLLPASHSSRFDPARDVPIKLVCDFEQRTVDLLGISKTAAPYSIFHGPGYGFDVLSYDKEGQEKYVLVKVTKAENPQTIELTIDETERIRKTPGRCWLYVIYRYDVQTTSGFYLVVGL